MACEYRERISAYYDGELPADAARQVETHLAQCASCARELAGLGRLSARLRGADRPRLTAHARRRLQQRIDWAVDPRLARTVGVLVAAAAAVLLACSAQLWFAAQRGAGSVTTWEIAALSPPTDAPGTSEELQIAHWMADDLR